MRSAALAILWLSLVGLSFGGCTLPREGDLALECAGDDECNDGNPCTTGRCMATGFCEVVVLDDVVLPQVAGDCRLAECIGGAVRQVPIEDPPADDNPCTVDRCEDGDPVNDAEALEGDACQLGTGTGTCQAGACEISCVTDGGCNDDRECTEDRCDVSQGICVFTPLTGVVAASEEGGDCSLRVCQDGTPTDVVDNGDLPDDLEDCTRDRCVEGTATFDDRPAGFGCDGVELAKLCNGLGACVECLDPIDCSHLSPNSACAQRTCVGGACGRSFNPLGTPVGTQTAGDCKRMQCDGNGNIQTVADPTDLPPATNCQTAACMGTTPVVTDLPLGTGCGGSGVCDGSGTCGQCNLPTDCGVDTECRAWQCVNQTCVANDTPAGTPVMNQTAGDCVEVQCNGLGQAAPVPVSDPFDDNNECTDDVCINGVPQNPNKGTTEPCSTGFCNGGGACVQCNNPGQCPQGDGICEVPACNANICSIDDQPMGTVAPMSEQTDGNCLTAVCDGMGEVSTTPLVNDADVPFDGNECTQDVCTTGTPSNPLESAGTICASGVCSGVAPGACVECVDDSTCTTGVETCDTGLFVCELDDGQPCTPGDCFSGNCIDGLCCNTVCGGTCEACDIVPGVCTLVGGGNDPDNECANGACDGMGMCVLDDGQVCTLDTECLSGNCVDGRCCNSACGGTCEACDIVPGVCTLVAAGNDPSNECANGACDGAGACGLDDGELCGMSGDCLSGNCVDGVCCDTACSGTCEACDIVPGVCSPRPDGTDPEAECAGADTCNGAGDCRCVDGMVNGDETGIDCGGSICGALCPAGQGCIGPTDCDSGICTGNVCQLAACGDGVLNGMELCDFAAPNSPCCASDCMGIAAAGTACGSDPDATGCDAAPICDGLGTALASCQAQTEANGTLCTSDGLFCTGAERCQAGVCTSDGDPCDGAGDGDANCQETCDEANDVCGADPNGSSCDDGVYCNGTETCAAGVCGGSTGDPCPGPNANNDCSESCNETNEDCTANDPDGSGCAGGNCTGGVCM